MAASGYVKKPLYVLSAVALIDQIDVSILRGVLPQLKEDFALSDFQLGLLGFAFVFVHAVATIPAGWVADRYSRTRIIGWTLLSWSGLSGLSALAVNFPTLFAARAALGIGQAVDDPSSTSLLTDYYPPDIRGRVFSFQQISIFLGGGIGLGLGAFVGSTLGWRWAFAIVGMPGSILAFFCFGLTEPRRGEGDEIHYAAAVAAASVAPVAPDDGLAPAAVTATGGTAGMGFGEFWSEARTSLVSEMKMIFGIRTMRYILVGVGILLFTVSGIGYWLSVYHDRYSGLTQGKAAGLTALILALAGVIGTLTGGRAADRVYGAGPAGRIRLVSTSILVCAGLFTISFLVPFVALRIVLQFVGVLAIAMAFPALRASMMDVVPAESRGVSVSAFFLTSTVFGTALAPPVDRVALRHHRLAGGCLLRRDAPRRDRLVGLAPGPAHHRPGRPGDRHADHRTPPGRRSGRRDRPAYADGDVRRLPAPDPLRLPAPPAQRRRRERRQRPNLPRSSPSPGSRAASMASRATSVAVPSGRSSRRSSGKSVKR